MRRRQFVVGQMRVEVKGADIGEKPRRVQIRESGERCDLVAARDVRGLQAFPISYSIASASAICPAKPSDVAIAR